MIQVASRVLLAVRYGWHANDVRSIVNILFSAEGELSCNYTRDLSATILFKLVDSYLIAFKFAQ